MRLSIVIPFLNEAENLPALHLRLSEVARQLRAQHGVEAELVMVDDGSTDGSDRIVAELAQGPGPAVKLVRLSRNFGSYAALPAGVAHAGGDAVAFLSADLQDPPEILLRLVERWREGYEVVFATRSHRDDPAVGKLFSRLYYSLMRRFAVAQMPPGGTDFCLVDRKVVDSLGDLQEKNSNLFVLLMWAGFRQSTIEYERVARTAGRSKWSMGKKLKLFIDSFVSFSFFPIRLISTVGAVLSFLGLLYAAFVAARAIWWDVGVQGWSSLMVVLLLVSGAQLLMLGIISEYLWRSFDASRNRPTYIVRDVEVFPAHREERV